MLDIFLLNIMDPEAVAHVDLSPYWDVDSRDYDNCECPGPPPPPQFVIPPPPPPPSLQLCRGGDDSDVQYCHLEPVGSGYTQALFPSLPVIAVCSSVFVVALLVASFIFWKHKKKVQNFLPCKDDHQGRCDLAGSNGVTYDDVLINHHPTRLPPHHTVPDSQTLTPIELLEVKYDNFGPTHLIPLRQGNFYPHHPHPHHHHSEQRGRSKKSKDHFNPIYEEVSGGSEERADIRSYNSDVEDSEAEGRTMDSEDDFAEDELSLAREDGSRPCSGTSSIRGSTGGDLCRDVGSSDGEGGTSEDGGAMRGSRGLYRSNSGHDTCKHTQSLERNKDGHSSDSFQAKQNYYMSKGMLGPDLAYPDFDRTSNVPSRMCHPEEEMTNPLDISDHPNSYPQPTNSNLSPVSPLGGYTRNSPPPPPYVPGLTSPRLSSQPSRRRPVPQFSTFHPKLPQGPNTLSPLSPAENIYSTIDDEEEVEQQQPSSQKHLVPTDKELPEEPEPYGDIRPDFETRITSCT